MRRCLILLSVILLGGALVGCEENWNRGECRVSFSFGSLTRSGLAEMPDTNDFILSISDKASGEELFRNLYKNRPTEITLAEGEYTFAVYSCEFDAPAFDTPLFGDIQSMYIDNSGAHIIFMCEQLNSGLKLIFGEDFKGQFPSSEMVLRQGEESLVYPYSEKRIAFFNSGKVDILLSTGEKSRVLLSRNLEPNEILTISFSVDLTDVTGVDFGIAIDTGRVWVSEKYVYGKERDGSVKSRALKVSDLHNMTGSEGVWVQGYIVGGDLSSSSATYAAPFTSRTNLMISESQSVGSREGCASVELKSGGVRDSLNLVDHPQWLGKMVYLKGNIVESYFGLVGIKNVSEYTFN